MGDNRVVIYPEDSRNCQSSNYVKLNVGGTLFYTTIGTLTKYDSMLRSMFSGRLEVLTDSEGWILIDRSGTHFGVVLAFLRDGDAPLPSNARELREILAEARYYCLQPLVDLCEQALEDQESSDYAPNCGITIVSNLKDKQLAASSLKKPIVRFSCNRQNNKYSYVANADTYILRNVEVFDKLALRFSERLQFIKDVLMSDEICLWTFYGNGRKISELDCTSIVYGQDKKHTKIECPEARIYEETAIAILYDKPESLPNEEMMRATRGKVGGIVAFQSTHDDHQSQQSHASPAGAEGGSI